MASRSGRDWWDRHVLTLKDFPVDRQIPQGTYRSVKTGETNRLRSRVISAAADQVLRPGQMGKGRPMQAGKVTREWSRVTLGSDGEAEFKVVCKKV